MKFHRYFGLFCLLAVTLFFTVIGLSRLRADNQYITVCQDGSCDYATIQQAVENAPPGSHVLVAAGTYTEQLAISQTLTIQGENVKTTQVNGNFAGTTVYVGPGTTVTLTQISISQGIGTIVDDKRIGGGLLNKGQLYLHDVSIADNSVNSSPDQHAVGGGIYNHCAQDSCGQLWITNSILHNNIVRGGLGGRGLGAAIYNACHDETNCATAIIRYTTILSNHARGGDGDPTPAGFAAGGGISNEGTLTITHSLVENNSVRGGLPYCPTPYCASVAYGGGIHSTGSLWLEKTTVANNSNFSFNGSGGLHAGPGSVTILENCTVSGNNGNYGGGIYNRGQMSIAFCTITQNMVGGFPPNDGYGGGIHNDFYNTEPIYLLGTIVADNLAPVASGGQHPDCFGLVESSGYNLIGEPSYYCNFQDDTTSILEVSPQLRSLAMNGGPTPTHAPVVSSPVLNKISEAICPDTDQRDLLRPYNSQGYGFPKCDIGSFEQQHIWRQYLPVILVDFE